MKKTSLILALALVMLFAFTATAFAGYADYIKTPVTHADGKYYYEETPATTDFTYPDGIYLPGATPYDKWTTADGNIHSDYQKNTDACAACHATHTAAGAYLLQWNGIQNTCYACHDGSIAETYNVEEGYIRLTNSDRTKGGLFGATGTSASIHATGAGNAIIDAPGGKYPIPVFSGEQEAGWGSSFECTSCHEPHGWADNYRILHPDPAGFLIEKQVTDHAREVVGGEIKNSTDPHDASPALFDWTTVAAFDATTRVATTGVADLMTAYPYSNFSKVQVTKSTGQVYYLDKGITFKAKDGIFTWNPAVTPVKDINGVVVTIESTDTLKFHAISALKVQGDVQNKLDPTNEVATYTFGMNNFCGACHVDYNTQKVLAVDGTDITAQLHAPSRNLNGTYTFAYRHKVGRDYTSAGTKKGLTFGKTLDADGVAQPEISCLTCHVAHGVDQTWWSDWKTDSGWAGTVSAESSGSSVLKRLPNMSTCEECHAKGKNNYVY